MFITWYNSNFRFVFTPKDEIKRHINPKYDIRNSKRFLIGAGQLSTYLGTEKNAETVLKTAEKMKTDKSTVKFRKYGKIEIYVK